MSRRKCELTVAGEALLRRVYEMTSVERRGPGRIEIRREERARAV